MTEFVLSPKVIREATSYNPFRNITADIDTADFEEDAYFEGATMKPMDNGQTIVEVQMRCAENSPHGNAGVKFRTDIWLNNAICAGTVRPADADERDWRSTKAGLRTLKNLALSLGIEGANDDTFNPVTKLTAADTKQGGMVHLKIRVFRANSGQHKWELNRVTKVRV